jgi:uncharacterized membrane protein YhaH (DUF805 family)
MTLEDKLFGFEGRLRRRDYWLLGLALGFVQVLLAQALVFAMVGPQATMLAGAAALENAQAPLPAAINAIVSLGFLWPGLALLVKRCHDRNHTAAVMVVAQVLWIAAALLPVKTFIANEATAMLVTLGFGAASLGVALWFLVDLGILDGTPGDNEYGPSPKGADRSASLIAAFE